MFLRAPVIIAVCCDRSVSWKRADGKDYGDVDAAIALDHMTLAATEADLGTCWIAISPCASNKAMAAGNKPALKRRRLRIENSPVFIHVPRITQVFILPMQKFLICPVQCADNEHTVCSDCFREINDLQVL